MPDLVRTAADVRRAVQRLSRRLQAERSPHGLSLTKISMLGHLARRGPMSPGQLAAADRLRPQSVTRVLSELTADGLVARAPDAADGRAHRLSVTPAGMAALAADMRERDRWLAGAMRDRLTPVERNLLVLAASLLERLADPDTEADTGADTGADTQASPQAGAEASPQAGASAEAEAEAAD